MTLRVCEDYHLLADGRVLLRLGLLQLLDVPIQRPQRELQRPRAHGVVGGDDRLRAPALLRNVLFATRKTVG